jgi:hypothetical protein
MAEPGESNIEFVQKLCENKKKMPRTSRLEFFVEILEAAILALVAIATAYSGYQAALWNGNQTELYTEAITLDNKADSLTIVNYESAIYNMNTLDAWLNAKLLGREKIAEYYERRFLPEFKVAFDAWIKRDPLNNIQVPAGPIYMPEYHSSIMEEANNLAKSPQPSLMKAQQPDQSQTAI